MNWLSVTVSYHPMIDVMRYGCVLLAGALVAVVIRHILQRHQLNLPKYETAMVVAFACLGFIAAVQSIEQLGKPMVWWRLPLLLLGLANALYAAFQMLQWRKRE